MFYTETWMFNKLYYSQQLTFTTGLNVKAERNNVYMQNLYYDFITAMKIELL